MGMFSNLKRTDEMVESRDYLGGEGFILDSDIYPAKIVSIYSDYFKSGAQFVQLKITVTKPDGTTQDYSERITLTNRNGGTYYIGKKDGKQHALPGFELFEDLCLLTLDKSPCDIVEQKKALPIWNKDAGKEVPTEVSCITELFGQEILVAIAKIRKNKQVADANGNYIDSADEMTVNAIRKFFHVDYKTTVPELRDGIANGIKPEDVVAKFYDKWLDKNQGKTVDEYKEVIGGGSTSSGFSGTTSSASGSSKSAVFGRRAG